MKNAVLLTIIVLCASCSPRLVPVNFNPENDIDIVEVIEQNNVTVYLEHIDKSYPHQVFDLEVINQSSDTINIAPQQIAYYSAYEPFAPISSTDDEIHNLTLDNTAIIKGRQFALSPYTINEQMERKVKAKKDLGIFLAVLTVGLAVYDGVKDADAASDGEWSFSDESNSLARDALVGASLIATELADNSLVNTAEDLDFLSYEVFPESKIAPGQKVRGKIFINAEDGIFRYYRFVVPVGNTDFVFDLRKNNTKTKKKYMSTY